MLYSFITYRMLCNGVLVIRSRLPLFIILAKLESSVEYYRTSVNQLVRHNQELHLERVARQ